eukprot:TRINITY_DN2348_c0_g1_i2.p1 TRINITY_DN2348_c0_g1~~TRINITY_DN2348_c0_g1_i2.p1  ORF type:complete len:205 (-),score=30.64 TRINITY_DN2348_c0_g1_i2:120-734(-)
MNDISIENPKEAAHLYFPERKQGFGAHRNIVSIFVIQVLAAIAVGLGLIQYYGYNGSKNDWELIVLWIAVLFALLTGIMSIVVSASRHISGLCLTPCISTLVLIMMSLSIIDICINFSHSKKTLQYCAEETAKIPDTTCRRWGDIQFCGADIGFECQRLHRGFICLICGFCVLFVAQILAIATSLTRRSKIMKDEYELVPDSLN